MISCIIQVVYRRTSTCLKAGNVLGTSLLKRDTKSQETNLLDNIEIDKGNKNLKSTWYSFNLCIRSWWTRTINEYNVLLHVHSDDINFYCSRTKSNQIIRSTVTCESARLIIISITISLGALALEDLRIVGRRAGFRSTMVAGATVLGLVENQTCTFASNDTPIWPLHRQLRGANRIDIARAARGGASARPALRSQLNGHVEAINETNIVEVLAAVCCQGQFH